MKILNYIKTHKIISIIVLVIIITGSFFLIKGNGEEKEPYQTMKVELGNIISSIEGTGQVSSEAKVSVKPKVSGEVIDTLVKNGEYVEKDTVLIKLDAVEALQELNEAQASYNNAKIELEELIAGADDFDVMQAENSLQDARDSLSKMIIEQENSLDNTRDNLENSYEDLYSDISDAFLDIPDIVTGINTVLNSDEIADTESSVSNTDNYSALTNAISDYEDRTTFQGYVNSAIDKYNLAKSSYDTNFNNYRDASRYDSEDSLEILLGETIKTTKEISDAVKSSINMLDWWIDYRTNKDLRIYTKVNTYKSSLGGYMTDINNHLSSLISIENNIEGYKEDIEEMEVNYPLNIASQKRTINEKEEFLNDLLDGPDEIDIKNKELVVFQKQSSLYSAQENYNNHLITAPISGIINGLDTVIGDTVSSSEILTISTNQMIVDLVLNEIDVSEVELGQKSILEFDAIENLKIEGEIIEIDGEGEVEQGVVSFGIKIGFTVDDIRVKPGMSSSISIVTSEKNNILVLPISAIKTIGQKSFVEVLINENIERKPIQTGISNDISIEITNGIKEGDEIITANGISTSNIQKTGVGDNKDAMRSMRMMTK